MSSEDAAAAAAAAPLADAAPAAAAPAPATAAVPLAADAPMSDVPSAAAAAAAAEQITDTAAVTPASDGEAQAGTAPHAAAAAAAESPVAAVAAPASAPAAPPAEASDDSASTAAAMSDVAAADSSAQAEPAEAAPVDAAMEPAAAAAVADAPAPAAAAAASDAAGAAPAAAQPAEASSSVPASPSQLQSPRKSGRAVHLTPKMEALAGAGQSALGSAALQLPPAASAPSSSSSLFSPRDIWMTPHQAALENKKMRAHSGWRFVPVAGAPKVQTLLQQVAGVDVTVGRQARPRAKHDDADADMPPTTPAAGRKNSRQSVATTPATASKKGSKRKAGSGEFAPTGDPSLDDKQRQLAQLAEQIEALKNQEKSILSGTPLPSTPLAYPVTPAAAAAATPTPAEKKRKPNPPAPVAIPSTPTVARQSSVATPGMTPATPSGVSRAGRNVKAPQHFADEQMEAATSARAARTLSVHLKSCRKLLEHLAAHKASQGIFAVPVNYNDPSRLYYAPGYLEAIGPTNHPMDLGTIRHKLTAFEYNTMHEFAADVRMVYRNAMMYNPENEWIHRAAADCMRIFEREIARIAELPEKRAPTHHHHHESHDDEDDEEHAHRRSSKKQAKRTRELNQLRTSLPDMQTDLLEQMTARILALEAKLAQSQPAVASYSPPMKAAPSPAYRPERERAEPVSRPPPQPAARKPSTPGPKQQQPLSQHEKQQLKDDIFKLPSHKLGPVVEIISRAMPKSEQKDGENEDEIEIDIDKLDIPTLRELQLYVKKALAALKRTTPAARRPTGGAPKSSPAARATPSAASPAHTSPFPRTSPAAHTMQSPSRLDMPSTPNLARGASQAVGSTTPALKYDSSSDDSDSDSQCSFSSSHFARATRTLRGLNCLRVWTLSHMRLVLCSV